MIMAYSSYEPTNFVAQLFLHPCVLMQSVLNNHQFRTKIIRDALPLLVLRRRHGNSRASPISSFSLTSTNVLSLATLFRTEDGNITLGEDFNPIFD